MTCGTMRRETRASGPNEALTCACGDCGGVCGRGGGGEGEGKSALGGSACSSLPAASCPAGPRESVDGGVGFGCVGNIAILALVVLIFVAAAVYCVCFRKRTEPDSGPVQHSKADEEWARAALAAAADSGGDGLDVGDVEIAE